VITDMNRKTTAFEGGYIGKVERFLQENRELKIRNPELIEHVRRVYARRKETAHG